MAPSVSRHSVFSLVISAAAFILHVFTAFESKLSRAISRYICSFPKMASTTMATVNVVAASSAIASTPVVKSSPTVSMGSLRGQRLVVGRGVSVSARRSVVVRAADVRISSHPTVQFACAGHDFCCNGWSAIGWFTVLIL